MITVLNMAAILSQPVTATLNYYLEPEDGGDSEFAAGTVGEKRRRYRPAQVLINDIRGHEDDFTLDKNGFQFVKKDCTEKTFDNEERIKQTYYPEVVDLIREHTGATIVKPFSHIVRQRSWKSAFEAEKDLPDDARSVGPSNARFVHCGKSGTQQSFVSHD